MKKYLILVFVLSFASCQEKKEKSIESIKVWYYNKIFDRAMAVGCDEIVYLPEKVDTIEFMLEDGSYFPKEVVILESMITNEEVLRDIAKKLKLAKETKDYGMDARMKCYIKFENGNTDSLCLVESPTYGYYNEQVMQFTNKFAYLIRKNCGFYQWIGISEMPYFDELNDPSFEREKVLSRSGEMY
jgi:hypothetical protein